MSSGNKLMKLLDEVKANLLSYIFYLVGLVLIWLITSFYSLLFFTEKLDELKVLHAGLSENLFKSLQEDFYILEKGLTVLSNGKVDSCDIFNSSERKPYNLSVIQSYKIYCEEGSVNVRAAILDTWYNVNDIIFKSKALKIIGSSKPAYRILIMIDTVHLWNRLDILVKAVSGYEYKLVHEDYKSPDKYLTSRINVTQNQYIIFGYNEQYIHTVKVHYILQAITFLVAMSIVYSGFAFLFAKRIARAKVKLVQLKLMEVEDKHKSVQINNNLLRGKFAKLKKNHGTIKKFQFELHNKINNELKVINKLFISSQEMRIQPLMANARKRIQQIQGLSFYEEGHHIIDLGFTDELADIVPEYLEYYSQNKYSGQIVSLNINEITLKQILFSIVKLICGSLKSREKVTFLLYTNETYLSLVFKITGKLYFDEENTNKYTDALDETVDVYLLSLEEIKELLILYDSEISISDSDEETNVTLSIKKYTEAENNDKYDAGKVH